ncbi:MAG: pimeloyl-[acyl-carrier protein] methyl ester esterase [Thiothrix nivea]|nr:MAG: pimeloyl-[acyl-carrier protein] methyl ester esterase [Thiothrix nivea]
MSQLFTRIEGEGQPLVVLHGWGMNHRVWEPVRQQLASHMQVIWIDLPGHGDSHGLVAESQQAMVDMLVEYIPPQAIVMGWSLGGLIAQALALQYPQRVRALILVASTPCFVQHDGWEHGLPESVLQTFAENLHQDYHATVKRFFALQFMGVRSDPQMIHDLRDNILSKPAAFHALETGLEILKTADFSQQTLSQPQQWILGRLDKLIPVGLAETLTDAQQQVAIMPRAAHVPFVTHPDVFLEQVLIFIRQVQHG